MDYPTNVYIKKKVSPVSTTKFDSKFINMVSKLTQNYGVDYVILSKDVSNRLPEIIADGANIVMTENTDLSVLSSKLHLIIFSSMHLQL